jgi:hypothetical protein
MQNLIRLFSNSNKTIEFATGYDKAKKVSLEITATQETEPLPGPEGILVKWTVSRGVAEVNPVLSRIKNTCRHQFVMIFEGRETGGTTNYWYASEASDVQTNNRYIVGTGGTPRAAYEDFCQRCEILLSSDPTDMEKARNYAQSDSLLLENMQEQARRCFMSEG